MSCLLVLTLAPVSALQGAEQPAAPSKSEQGRKLPLTASFAKGSGSEGPQYTLTLKNEGQETITAKAVILHSVVVHNRPKTRELPEQMIAAGDTWTIPELAAMDKVTVTARGYEPLEVVVP